MTVLTFIGKNICDNGTYTDTLISPFLASQ